MKLICFTIFAMTLAGSACFAANSSGAYKARCVPHVVSGKTAGFQCSNIGNGSNYDKAGLMDGDIVVSIDQIKIDSPNTAMTMFEQIDKGTCKEIVISRAGKQITLTPVF